MTISKTSNPVGNPHDAGSDAEDMPRPAEAGAPIVEACLSTRWGPTMLATMEVQGQPVQASVDTSATGTILSEEFYQTLLPKLEDTGDTYTVKLNNTEDGCSMRAQGGVSVKIKLGSHLMDWKIIIIIRASPPVFTRQRASVYEPACLPYVQ